MVSNSKCRWDLYRNRQKNFFVLTKCLNFKILIIFIDTWRCRTLRNIWRVLQIWTGPLKFLLFGTRHCRHSFFWILLRSRTFSEKNWVLSCWLPSIPFFLCHSYTFRYLYWIWVIIFYGKIRDNYISTVNIFYAIFWKF